MEVAALLIAGRPLKGLQTSTRSRVKRNAHLAPGCIISLRQYSTSFLRTNYYIRRLARAARGGTWCYVTDLYNYNTTLNQNSRRTHPLAAEVAPPPPRCRAKGARRPLKMHHYAGPKTPPPSKAPSDRLRPGEFPRHRPGAEVSSLECSPLLPPSPLPTPPRLVSLCSR